MYLNLSKASSRKVNSKPVIELIEYANLNTNKMHTGHSL